MKRLLAMWALSGVMLLSTGYALAADQDRIQDKLQTQTQDKLQTQTPYKVQTQDQEMIYGSHLMTRQERAEYRAQLRAAKTDEERQQIRIKHHERMKERAKQRGVGILPDEPPVRGVGPGPGGMGPGPGGVTPVPGTMGSGGMGSGSGGIGSVPGGMGPGPGGMGPGPGGMGPGPGGMGPGPGGR